MIKIANVLRKRTVEFINLTLHSYRSSAAAILCLAMITLGLATFSSDHSAKTGELNVASVAQNQSSTTSPPIPFSELGAKATADYKGDGIGLKITDEGPQLRTDFQKLSGIVSSTGLSLDSTAAKGGRLHLSATSIGRNTVSETNPARRILQSTGTVAVEEKIVTYVRPGLTEEYSVSADGVRQDFIVAERSNGSGELSVELALDGARASAAADGARLTLTGSGRTLAYNKLRVVDGTGRDLKARIDILSPTRLAVRFDDTTAVYPVRIDPTFSDANWVSLNPGIPGLNGNVSAITADGSGNIYAAGNFTFAGTIPANTIAKWDGATWSALGSGFGGVGLEIDALAILGTDLYAAGVFSTAGGVPAANIAKWNGSAWSSVGSGMDSGVFALAVIGTDLYAGGRFTVAGGVPANSIAKWNGSTWSTLGSGITAASPFVEAMAVMGTDLYVGGQFSGAGGVPVSNIARWNGSAWSAVGSGTDSMIRALAVVGTDVYAGGFFSNAGGAPASRVAKWNGSSWSALGTGVNNTVFALAAVGTDLYVGGGFNNAGGVSVSEIAKWNGSSWSALGSGASSTVISLAVVGTNLYVGGGFNSAGGVTALRIAKWDGSTWSAFGSGMDAAVNAFAMIGTDLYVGGTFSTVNGGPATRIAKWDGSTWSALGSGINNNPAISVNALAVIGTDLYAAGQFSIAGGVPVSNIAKWNGGTWSALGSGISSNVAALAVIGTDLYAGGSFTTAGGAPAANIAKWNGSAWSALGSGTNNGISALAVIGTDLYAGGGFTTVGGVPTIGIAKWNGSAWSALGSGMNNSVISLAVSGTDLYAGGFFTTAGGVSAVSIAKWNGSAWSALGSGTNGAVVALTVSGTDVYAGGNFTTAGGISANRIAKWDGGAWSPMGSGMDGQVNALVSDNSGHLFVGGNFMFAGTTVSPFVAQADILTASADGSGTMSVTPSTGLAGATQSFTFTYTAAAGGLSNGEIDIAIPAGWSGGGVTSSAGSAVINSGVIQVTGITLASGSMTIGLNNVSVTSTPGPNAFTTQEKSTSGGTLTNIAVQPVVNVTTTVTSDMAVSGLNVASGQTLTIATGATLTITGDATIGGILDVAGAFTVGGTFTSTGGLVEFIGTGPQTVPAFAYNNLTINNSGGSVTLGGDASVGGILQLLSDLNTSSFTLTESGTSSGTSDVIGTVSRSDLGASARSFGNPFTTVQIDSGSAPGSMTITLSKGTSPSDATTGQTNSGFPNAIQRTYVITPTGGSGFSATLELHYLPGELNGNTEGSLNLWRFDSGTGKWNNMGSSGHDTSNHAVTQTGITQFSPWTLNSVVPTAANLEKFTATAEGNGTFLQWQTGFEVNNLGFNIYRETNGERIRVNPSLIAGSALAVGNDVKVEAGYSYNWQDDAVNRSASYWLEDIDLDGTSTWHGPYGVTSASAVRPRGTTRSKSVLLNNLAAGKARNDNAITQREYPAGLAANSTYGPAISQTNGRTPTKATPIPAALQKQWQIASQNAIKIVVNKTGWYHINMIDLMAAGLDSSINPDALHMYVGGIEVPIRINTGKEIGLTADASIEFYGVALDTPTTDTQVYWLVTGNGNGKRIAVQQSPAGNSNTASSFQYTVERKDRTVYFSSLRNGDAENFFGSVIASQPVSYSINVHHVDLNSTQAEIEIALQGVTASSHQVNVMLNGVAIHAITFNGQAHPVTKISIPQSSLTEGGNQITFAAQGSGDVSLVDYVKVTYAHTYAADSNHIFTAQTGIQPVKITGFTSGEIRAINVANPSQPVEITGTIDQEDSGYAISIGAAKRGEMLVFAPDQMLSPAAITTNQPSTLTRIASGADLVVVTYRDFAHSIQPLVALRQSQGYQVSVIDVENIYDEFSYGVHSPKAVKDFLDWTYLHWQKQPQYVLLAGSGTLDPRNYTGLGFMDFVPTKLIDTDSMETASDDWFVDFNNDGQPQMAIGRLPVRTAAEMTTVVNKIVGYEQSGNPEAMVLVSDLNDGVNFNANNNQIKSIVGSQIATTDIVRGQTNSDAKTELMDQLTQGQRIFNYAGHGSVNLWRGNLLTGDDVQALTNTNVSPLVVTMTCLNGYFQDPHLASLGESLLKVNQGGAVSVWASTGMTDAGNQTALNQEFFRQLFGNQNITIGQAIRAAKSSTNDNDVRRTWILFGDPTMRIKR